MLSSLSRKMVAMSVPLSRFFMSSLARDSSSTLRLQLGVDGLQLLVERLQLLLGGLELLVGALQLLVGGLQLLVGGLELLVGGLELLDGRSGGSPWCTAAARSSSDTRSCGASASASPVDGAPRRVARARARTTPGTGRAACSGSLMRRTRRSTRTECRRCSSPARRGAPPRRARAPPVAPQPPAPAAGPRAPC